METTGLNATELGGYCRETELYHEQVARWRKAVQDDKRDIKRLQLELRRMDKAPLLIRFSRQNFRCLSFSGPFAYGSNTILNSHHSGSVHSG
jgi:hypothetical protein